MRIPAIWFSVPMLVVLAVSTSQAQEVVEFRDGRYLEVRSHLIVQDALRLNVTEISFLVIPLSKIDCIERHGREVYRHRDPVDGQATAGLGRLDDLREDLRARLRLPRLPGRNARIILSPKTRIAPSYMTLRPNRLPVATRSARLRQSMRNRSGLAFSSGQAAHRR